MALMSKCVFPSGTRSTTVSHRVGGRSKPNNHVPPGRMAARFRLDTTSLRGVYNQQIHGSKRSLRSVENFSECEQRTAYLWRPCQRDSQGRELPSRPNQVAMMAQMQNIIDFPIEPVGTRVLEDRAASILPYFDDS